MFFLTCCWIFPVKTLHFLHYKFYSADFSSQKNAFNWHHEYGMPLDLRHVSCAFCRPSGSKISNPLGDQGNKRRSEKFMFLLLENSQRQDQCLIAITTKYLGSTHRRARRSKDRPGTSDIGIFWQESGDRVQVTNGSFRVCSRDWKTVSGLTPTALPGTMWMQVNPLYQQIRQKRRRLGPEHDAFINNKVKNLLDVGFIREVQYP